MAITLQSFALDRWVEPAAASSIYPARWMAISLRGRRARGWISRRWSGTRAKSAVRAARALVSPARRQAARARRLSQRAQGAALQAGGRHRRHAAGQRDRYRRRHRHVVAYASKGPPRLPDGEFVSKATSRASRKSGSVRRSAYPVAAARRRGAYQRLQFSLLGIAGEICAGVSRRRAGACQAGHRTAYVTDALVRLITSPASCPRAALQLICGATGDLLDHLGRPGCRFRSPDRSTPRRSCAAIRHIAKHSMPLRRGARLAQRRHSRRPTSRRSSPSSICSSSEVVREMTVKAGQKCTAIRRVLVAARNRTTR